MKIGDKIKEYRNIRGITQQQLGDLIGKSVNTIKKYESGYTTPPMSVIEDIAESLMISTTDLIPQNNIFAGPGKYIGEKPYDPVKEFELVNEECSEDEKQMILQLVKHYNWGYCNNRYDLSKLNDEDYIDLKAMFYTTIKTVLRDYAK